MGRTNINKDWLMSFPLKITYCPLSLFLTQWQVSEKTLVSVKYTFAPRKIYFTGRKLDLKMCCTPKGALVFSESTRTLNKGEV